MNIILQIIAHTSLYKLFVFKKNVIARVDDFFLKHEFHIY